MDYRYYSSLYGHQTSFGINDTHFLGEVLHTNGDVRRWYKDENCWNCDAPIRKPSAWKKLAAWMGGTIRARKQTRMARAACKFNA